MQKQQQQQQTPPQKKHRVLLEGTNTAGNTKHLSKLVRKLQKHTSIHIGDSSREENSKKKIFNLSSNIQ